MGDGSVWEVPVIRIATDHAEYYAKVDGVSFEDALKETLALFDADDYEVEDWAKNNMDWIDVVDSARCITRDLRTDFQEGWMNGEAEVVNPQEA